jgi:hypothetical protein
VAAVLPAAIPPRPRSTANFPSPSGSAPSAAESLIRRPNFRQENEIPAQTPVADVIAAELENSEDGPTRNRKVGHAWMQQNNRFLDKKYFFKEK